MHIAQVLAAAYSLDIVPVLLTPSSTASLYRPLCLLFFNGTKCMQLYYPQPLVLTPLPKTPESLNTKARII